MNRQWFWYPHPSLESYLRALHPPLYNICIRPENSSIPIVVETDEPRLLDLLLAKRFHNLLTPASNNNIPRLTYLHNGFPIEHEEIVTPDNLLHGSRDRTDVAFIPQTSRVLLHRPTVESMVKNINLTEEALSNFLIAYSFGLMKSLINGLASFAEHESVGCHGAVFKVDGKGVALLGATGAGKSTHALRFLLSNESAILITDDWSIVHYHEANFTAVALEQQFFARRAQIEELLSHYPKAIGPQERLNLVEYGPRIDLDLRSLLGQSRFAEQTKLDVLVCITRDFDGKTEIRKIGKDEFINHAIRTSPHIPFHSTNTGHYIQVKEKAGDELYATMLLSLDNETQFWGNVYDLLPVYLVSYLDSSPEATVQGLIAQAVRSV